MVQRNDPCPSGSGKKYKRCCGSTSTNVMDLIVNEELDAILSTYFDKYPKGIGKKNMQITMRKWMQALSESWTQEHIEEASSEYFLFIEDKTSWPTYLAEAKKNTSRQVVSSSVGDVG